MPLSQLPSTLLIVLAAVLGLVLGSFYSVCVSRYLSGESIIFPPSHCPLCGRRLRPWELIPILSYLLLRGRCAGCKGTISPLYPLIELTSAVWAVLTLLQVGPTLWFPAYLALGGLYIVASAIDFSVYLLPDILTYPAALLGLAIGAARPEVGLLAAVLGAACGSGLFWLLATVYRRPAGHRRPGRRRRQTHAVDRRGPRLDRAALRRPVRQSGRPAGQPVLCPGQGPRKKYAHPLRPLPLPGGNAPAALRPAHPALPGRPLAVTFPPARKNGKYSWPSPVKLVIFLSLPG